MSPQPAVYLLSVALLVALGGCERLEVSSAGGRQLTVWVANEMVGLTEQTAPVEDEPIFDRERKAVSLFAAANETVSFQIVVDAKAEAAKGLRISWTELSGPLRSTIQAMNVRAFRMLPIRVSEYPAWYLRLVDAVPSPAGVYDPLVPVDGSEDARPAEIDPGGRLAFWIDVHVPREAAPGTYRGSLAIGSSSHAAWKVEVSLDVHSFVLPDARPVPAIGGFDHQEVFAAFLKRNGKPFHPVYLDRNSPLVRQGLVLVRQLMRLAHDHRVDLFDKRVRPIMKRAGPGKVRLQWEDYDAVVTPYLEGTAFDDRIGCAAWPVPVSQDWPKPEHYGGSSSDLYAQTMASLLTACREHLVKRARTEHRWFFWPCRDPAGSEAYSRHARLAGIARKVDPNTPILCQLPPAPPARTGWQVPPGFRATLDILAPPGAWLDPAQAALASPSHPLKGLWLSAGPPPYVPSLGMVATPADVRALSWFAMKYKCTGLFLPEVLHWSEDPFAPLAGSQTRLFYPGTIAGIDGPLPSVRLKRLRRGLQDAAYLWILQRRRRPGIARAAMSSLVRYAGLAAAGDNYLDPRLDGWVSAGQTWLLARRILAEEVQAAVNPQMAHRLRTLRHRLAWKQLNEQTRRLRLEQARSWVTPAGRQPDLKRFRVTVLLDLSNEYGREANVTAGFGKLPEGWKPAGGPRWTGRLAPLSRQAIRLTAEGPGPLPTGPDARMHLPVRLTADVENDREIPVSIPFLIAGRSRKPPKIDGLLNDWPPRLGNTAREFRLIGRRGRGKGLAERQTMAFVLRGKENLYIAFRCEEPNLPGVVKRSNNLVRYEQLMAYGEDLVEVLLDPGGKAKGPEDLYHVIVKPNGVLIGERGIRTDPPLGAARSWSASATVAVRTQADAWTVELAIPLASFGPDGQAAFWRANFARFATQGAEASSWSGVSRYFYDPRNLGTMFLGAAPRKPD